MERVPSGVASSPFSICVVNWNGEATLASTLRAALAQSPPPSELLLVDNHSSDASVALVRESFPAVRILPQQRNRGPAAARNVGFRAARWDRILFLDSDVAPSASCAALLSRALDEDVEAVAATPRLVFAERPETVQCDGADGHFLGLQILRGAGRRPEPGLTPRRAGSLVSACFLLDRGRWGTEAPFDEDFFIFLEDHDFGLRTRLAGHALTAVPGALCRHGGGTPGLSMRPGRGYPRRRAGFLIRNRWQLLLADYELRSLVVLAPLLVAFEALQLVGLAARGWLPEWATAARWVWVHWPRIRAKRRRVQAGRRRPDREILRGGPVPLREELLDGPAARGARRVLDRLAAGYWAAARRML